LLALFLLAHGIAQVIAVSWAILPKANSNFARPSLASLPWRSYIFFGLASYASGAVLLLMVNYVAINVSPFSNNPVPTINRIGPYTLAMIFSVYFPTITVCLSLLTDLHLRRRTHVTQVYRVRDAVVSAAAMMSVNLMTRFIIWHLSGQEPPTWAFFYIVGALGLLAGALVPGSAASYLSASDDEGSTGDRHDPVAPLLRTSRAIGSTREYHA
jgi:hypothetical protein